jgi:CBS domain-containing protein
MLLAMVPTRRPVCIDRDATIVAASRLMRDQRVGELVVTEALQGKLIPSGMISAREIITRVLALELDAAVLTVGDICWSGPTSVRFTDTLPEALERLYSTGNEALPVVDGEGGVAGVVAMDDILQALSAETQSLRL